MWLTGTNPSWHSEAPVAERERNERQKSFASDHFDYYLASDRFSYGVGENDYTSPMKNEQTGPGSNFTT